MIPRVPAPGQASATCSAAIETACKATSCESLQAFHGRYTVVRRMAAGGMGAVYEVSETASLMLSRSVVDSESLLAFGAGAVYRAGSEGPRLCTKSKPKRPLMHRWPFVTVDSSGEVTFRIEPSCTCSVRAHPTPQ